MLMYLQIALKLVTAFIAVIIVLRVTGKSSMAQLSVIDVIGNMILGSIIGGIIYNTNIHIYDFLVILGIWVFIMLSMHYLQIKSDKAKRIIVGAPLELIHDGKVIVSSLAFAKMDAESLQTLLRMKGINSIRDVMHVQLEPNGDISVIKKGQPDFGYMLLEEGEIIEDSLRRINKDEVWLRSELEKQGFIDLEQLYCVEYYDGQLTIVTNNEVEKADAKLEKQQNKEVLIDENKDIQS